MLQELKQRKPQISSLGTGLAVLFVVCTLLRLLFLAGNFNRFHEASWQDITLSLFAGLRFDASLLASTTGVFFPFLAIVPFLPKTMRAPSRKTILACMILLNATGIALGIADVGYYPMAGRRSTFELVTMLINDWRQILPMTKAYPILWVITGVLLIPTTWALKTFTHGAESLERLPRAKFVVSYLAGTTLIVLAFRGGLQVKPLAPTHAYTMATPALADLALNSAFTVSRTYANHTLDTPDYFSDWNEVLRQVQHPALQSPSVPLSSSTPPPNFVIIIIESLGSEYSGAFGGNVSYTPFLDSLAKRSRVYFNFFANGRRSIEASTSIFFGIPSLMPDPLIQSPYAAADLRGLPYLLQKKNYASAFFHGGAKGSMFFDVMARKAGFQHHWSSEDYPDKSQHDGSWGIYDRPFLRWSVNKISELQTPFISGIFTLSSHSPFVLPPDESVRFPRGTLDIHQAIGYTDDSLRDFFSDAEKTSWYKNTYFFITGDHTSLSDITTFSELGLYRVPLLMFHPEDSVIVGREEHVAQHVDIMPTVLELAKSTQDGPLFGRPLLRSDGGILAGENSVGRSINSLAGVYWYSEDHDYSRFDGNAGWEFSTLAALGERPIALPDTKRHDVLKKKLLAQLQYFNQGLKEGRLYDRP